MTTFEETKRRKVQAQIKKRKEAFELKGVKATLSQATRDRLLSAALSTFGVYDDPDIIKSYLNEKIDAFLKRQPFWFGRTEVADAQHRSNLRRYLIGRGLLQAEAQPAHLARRNMSIEELITIDEGQAGVGLQS